MSSGSLPGAGDSWRYAMAKEYRIPVNIKKGGYVLNGLLETRKAVEAVIGALLGFIVCQLLPLKGIVVIIVFHFLFIVSFALIGLLGVRGEPFSVFFVNYIHWKRNRKKPFIYNPNGETFAGSPTKMIFEERDAGDAMADMLDALKARFAKERPEYIEGKTFTFSEDPLVARLHDIEQMQQERLQQESEEPQSMVGEEAQADIDVSRVIDALEQQTQNESGETDGEA